MKKRPPIVVIMGHVDHGKTTLLDYIKKTNLAAKEAGGITQSIGAYEITHTASSGAQEKITFIDTPGHEAFAKMRARGSQAADIAILVVAADEGVKPQTKEAHQIIKDANLQLIIAINKIDKTDGDVSIAQNQLAKEDIMLEGEGGNVSWKAISAKTGQGVDELLGLIILTAEMEELKYNPANPAKGYLIESHLDRRRGVLASAIVQDGILRTGDEIMAAGEKGKIKSIENWLGQKIEQAEPSAPVLILGFSEIPEAGVDFFSITHPALAATATAPLSATLAPEKTASDKQPVNLILNANDSGSLEALIHVISNLPIPENYRFNIINQSIGDITDGDVKLAVSTQSIVIGFKVRIDKAAENLAKDHKIAIKTSAVVYELVKELEEWINKLKEEKNIGDLEVLAVFGKKSGNKNIIGGQVVAGEIINNRICFLMRNGKELGQGKITNLQKNKAGTNKVEAGNECGLLIVFEGEIKIGDHVIIKE